MIKEADKTWGTFREAFENKAPNGICVNLISKKENFREQFPTHTHFYSTHSP